VCGYDTQRDAHQVRQLIWLTGQYASVDEGLSGTSSPSPASPRRPRRPTQRKHRN